jgi:hypothetical protein
MPPPPPPPTPVTPPPAVWLQLTDVIVPVYEDPPLSVNVLPGCGGLSNTLTAGSPIVHNGRLVPDSITSTGRTIVTVVAGVPAMVAVTVTLLPEVVIVNGSHVLFNPVLCPVRLVVYSTMWVKPLLTNLNSKFTVFGSD